MCFTKPLTTTHKPEHHPDFSGFQEMKKHRLCIPAPGGNLHLNLIGATQFTIHQISDGKPVSAEDMAYMKGIARMSGRWAYEDDQVEVTKKEETKEEEKFASVKDINAVEKQKRTAREGLRREKRDRKRLHDERRAGKVLRELATGWTKKEEKAVELYKMCEEKPEIRRSVRQLASKLA
jgi:hypothetical protein